MPRDHEEETEAERQRRRRRRNAFFIPRMGGGLDSDSEGVPYPKDPKSYFIPSWEVEETTTLHEVRCPPWIPYSCSLFAELLMTATFEKLFQSSGRYRLIDHSDCARPDHPQQRDLCCTISAVGRLHSKVSNSKDNV